MGILLHSWSQIKVPASVLGPRQTIHGNSFSCVFSVHTTDKLNMCSVTIALHSLEFKQHLTPFVFTDAYWFCSCYLLAWRTILV